MRSITTSAGIRSGLMLGLAAALLAILGLSPRFSWIPEVPLIVVAIAVPLAVLGWTGRHVVSRTGSRSQAALAGAIAGGIGGFVGGLAYLFSGKPALNLLVGAILGGMVGALAAAVGALLNRKSESSRL